MIGVSILNLPGLLAAGRPRLAAAIAILLSALCLWSLQFIQFDNDVERSIISNTQLSRDYVTFIGEVEQGSSDIVILAEADDAFSREDLEALRNMALDIELADGVVAVMSPFAARFARNHPRFASETVIPLEPAPAIVAERLRTFMAGAGAVTPMITPGLDAAMLVVVIDDSDIAEETILASLSRIVAAASVPGVTMTVTGETAISVEIVDRMKLDLLYLNLFGDLIGLAIAVVLFRRPAAIIAAMGPAVFGALAAISMFALTGYPITVLSNVIPILAYVLGLADGTHLVSHYASLDRTRPVGERVFDTVRAIGPACGLTAVTTAIAFAAIAISDNQPLREFAIVGALAALAAYCAVMVWFVVLAGWLDPAHAKGRAGLPLPPLPAAVKALALGRPVRVIAVGTLVMVGAATGYATTTPWFSLYENIPESSPVRLAAERAEDRFGGFFRIWLEYDTPARDTQEGWLALAAQTAMVERAAPAGNAITPATLSRWLGHEESPPTDSELADIGHPLTGILLPPGEPVARAMVLTGDPMRSRESLRQYDAIEDAARASGAQTITGLPVLMRHEPLDLIRQLSVGLVIACTLCVVLVASVYRSPRLLFAMLVPNLLPLAVTASALHILRDGQMTPSALLALTIAFGIAVDDSIHLVNRYFLECRSGYSDREALSRAMDEVGKVMIATTLLICGGLLVTFASAFSTVRLFGAMLIIAFVVALIADLLLLPALLRVRWRQ
jgi:predicted RND superfamily exporter protein